MDVLKAIGARKSVRAFKLTAVPREVLVKIIEMAQCAPSCENTQPWELVVVTGHVLDALKQELGTRRGASDDFTPDIPVPVPTYQPPYSDRGKEVGRGLFTAMGIERHDRDRRMDWQRTMARYFDAPVAIVVYVEKYLGTYATLDAGLFLQNLALAAISFGLGTCVHIAGVLYPDVLRTALGIGDSKLILCGVSIGYPDESHPSQAFRSGREPLDTFVSWHGFDE